MKRLNPHNTGSRRHDGLKPLHQKSGVYLLLIGRTLYIGSSKDLRSRLRSWSSIYPGAQYAVFQCSNYREREQHYIDKLKAQQLRITNTVSAVKPARTLKGRPPKKIKPPGPGRVPSRMITVGERTQSLTDWCHENKIEKSLFYARLRIGWTEQEAIGKKTHT